MSEIKKKIEEINKTAKKSRRINNLLWVFVVLLVGVAFYTAFEAITQKNKADTLAAENNELYLDALYARNQLAEMDSLNALKIDSLLTVTGATLWEQARSINTLNAYSNYVENNEDIDQELLDQSLKNLLNKSGYVQLIETNGNPLFTTVNLALEGEFIKFKTDKSVRNGAIGIKDCGSSTLRKIGVVLQGKTVKILNKCEASGSKSVWAQIAYSN